MILKGEMSWDKKKKSIIYKTELLEVVSVILVHEGISSPCQSNAKCRSGRYANFEMTRLTDEALG